MPPIVVCGALYCRIRLLPLAIMLMSGMFCHADTGADEATAPSVSQKAEFTDEQLAFARDKIQPLLLARCAECHGATAEGKGGLRLSSRETMLSGGDSGPVLVPFKPDDSLLISAVRYEDFEMPPRSRLPQGEVELLEQWIRMGAPWPTDTNSVPQSEEREVFPLEQRKAAHWAWHPVSRPEIPASGDAEWAIDDVDRFVLRRLTQKGLTPAVDADRRALIRRLYFDLIGLPPTIEQQERFLNDPADLTTAITSVVDELLNSPHFGERWARHWLDLVRYAETLGHEFDYPLPHAWRYRDYVIRAINNDVPYDHFVMEHIAGDLLSEPRLHPEGKFNESIIATGFWYLHEDKHAPVDVKGEEAARVDNQIDVFSKTFLGLTVACARCHDHKFDAITTQDYYALAGFLKSSRRRVAMLDPDQKIQQAADRIRSIQESAERLLRQDLKSWTVDRLADVLVESLTKHGTGQRNSDAEVQHIADRLRDRLQHAAGFDEDHPLSLPAELARNIAAGELLSLDELASVVDRWNLQVAKAVSRVSETQSTVFADFRDGIPDGWLTYGSAFRHFRAGESHSVSKTNSNADTGADTKTRTQRVHRSLAAGGIDWTGDGPKVVVSDHVSSGELAPALTGVLQSPSFELTHPEILVEVAGQGSRLRLVIDGYVMNEFSELLFRGARHAIDTDGKFQWIRLEGDIQKYLGHRCYLEFLDEGTGWFAVREVRMVSKPGGAIPKVATGSDTNRQLSSELSQNPGADLYQIAQRWSRHVLQDSGWPALAAELEALPILRSPEFIALTEAWQKEAEAIPGGVPVLVMCDGSSEDESVFIRGSHRNLGPVVPRRFLQVYSGQEPIAAGSGSGRLELAKKLLSEENPYPARVAVNRIWQHLFGVGLVSSADNLGVLGAAPSHPELLDYLADQFRRDEWSTKRLIRRLVLTRTYRLSSQRDNDADTIDPRNQLLHRANIRRLEGEVIRDAMLSISGRLQSELYGQSVPVHLTEFMQGRGRPAKSGPLDGAGRRSIYQSVNRNFLSPFMLAFDSPIPATTVGRRSISNVPAQALILLNNEFVSQHSEVWADKLLHKNHADFEALVQTAFREAFCRQATTAELDAVRGFMVSLAEERAMDHSQIFASQELVAELCHVLLNQKEFLFLD